jgi:CheY-like chemotaxis protein
MFTVRAREATMLRTDTTPFSDGNPRALVLHGDEAVRGGLRSALEERRVATLTAADGVTGFERLLDELLSLDVLVMALDLPGRDARTLARLIRKTGNERDLALVVIADSPTPALRLELRGLGIDAIVDHADGPQAITSAVLDVVRRREEAEEIVLEAWRHAPAAEPLGETTWSALGRGEMAMVA